VTAAALLMAGCGPRDIEGGVRPAGGVTLTLRFNDRPIAIGAFYSGMVIVKTGDHYGWLTDGYDVGEVTVRETTMEIAGHPPGRSTSVIAINPAGSRDMVWNLNYGAAPALTLTA
jgi:hypothetical protein